MHLPIGALPPQFKGNINERVKSRCDVVAARTFDIGLKDAGECLVYDTFTRHHSEFCTLQE